MFSIDEECWSEFKIKFDFISKNLTIVDIIVAENIGEEPAQNMNVVRTESPVPGSIDAYNNRTPTPNRSAVRDRSFIPGISGPDQESILKQIAHSMTESMPIFKDSSKRQAQTTMDGFFTQGSQEQSGSFIRQNSVPRVAVEKRKPVRSCKWCGGKLNPCNWCRSAKPLSLGRTNRPILRTVESGQFNKQNESSVENYDYCL